MTKQPDNSVLILLFGIMALFLVIGFIWLYVTNLRSTRANYIKKRDGKHIATNKEELASLLDSPPARGLNVHSRAGDSFLHCFANCLHDFHGLY